MQITLTWQTISTAAGVLGGFLALCAAVAGLVRWFDKHKQRDKDIKELHDKHDADMAAVKQELSLIVEGLLACLKGLQEQGCNGPVTAAVTKLETHLNAKAHE